MPSGDDFDEEVIDAIGDARGCAELDNITSECLKLWS